MSLKDEVEKSQWMKERLTKFEKRKADLDRKFPLPEDTGEDLLSEEFWNSSDVLRQIHEVATTHVLSGEAILNFCLFNLAASVQTTCMVLVPWERTTELFWDPVVHGPNRSRKTTAMYRAEELVEPSGNATTCYSAFYSRGSDVTEVKLDEGMISQDSISWVYARPQKQVAEEEWNPVDVTPIGDGVATWAAENTKPVLPFYWSSFWNGIDPNLPRYGGNHRAEFSWRIRASVLLGLLHKETQPNRLCWDLSKVMYDSSQAAKKFINHPNWWAHRNAPAPD